MTPLRANPRTAPPVPRRRFAVDAGVLFDAFAIAAFGLVRLFSPAPAWVERAYSNGFYPAADRAVRALTGPLPFCLGDVLFVVALAGLAAFWTRALGGRGSRRIRLLRALVALRRTVACAAVVFVWFVISWGYNYARIPVERKVIVHVDRVDARSVTAFAESVADALDRDVDAAHHERLDDDAMAARLVPAFQAAIGRLGDDAIFPPPRVKPTMFQRLMEVTGTSGFTDPWTHEVNVDAGAFFFERPAIYAHEWGHIAGFADEAEANFISVLACTNSSDPLLRYSGRMLTWFNLPSTVRIKHRLRRQVYADIVAIRKRYLERTNARAANVQRVAYDRYLHANHVAAGYASYGLFVRWLTGADFDRNGLPLVRPVAEPEGVAVHRAAP